MARKDEIVWLRRESVTYKIHLDEQTTQFCKSYDQREVERAYHQVFGGQAAAPFLFIPYPLDTQIYLYDREVKFLKALAEIGLDRTKKSIVPKVCEENRKNLQIFMEYLPYGTYQSEFFKAGSNELRKNHLTAELVQILADIHKNCKEDIDYISTRVNTDGKVRLRARSLEEEIERWEKHLLLILFNYGENLQEYWGKLGETPKKSREIRKGIKTFLGQHGVDLNQMVGEFIENDRTINGTEITLIHGDYRPQNVFYIPAQSESESREIKICDLDKTRLGSPLEDLATAIDNFYRYPLDEERERFSQLLARSYFEQRKYSEQESVDNLAGVVSSRLKEVVRYFGVNCQLGWEEIKLFLEKPVANRYAGKPEQCKRDFLQDHFLNSLGWFFSYYHSSGEGFSSTVNPSLKNRGIVSQQLDLLSTVFRICGVPPITSPLQQQKKNKKKAAA